MCADYGHAGSELVKLLFFIPNPCINPRRECDQQSRHNARIFFQTSELGPPPPTPSSAGECVPSPFGSGGDTLSCGRVGGVAPIRTRGQTLWYILQVCTVFFVV